MAEEALRRRFVFYAALKSRFTAPFSAANNSGGGDDDYDDNDADVDEQKERTKEKAVTVTEQSSSLCLSLRTLSSICPSAPPFPRLSPQSALSFLPVPFVPYGHGQFLHSQRHFCSRKNAERKRREAYFR